MTLNLLLKLLKKELKKKPKRGDMEVLFATDPYSPVLTVASIYDDDNGRCIWVDLVEEED